VVSRNRPAENSRPRSLSSPITGFLHGLGLSNLSSLEPQMNPDEHGLSCRRGVSPRVLEPQTGEPRLQCPSASATNQDVVIQCPGPSAFSASTAVHDHCGQGVPALRSGERELPCLLPGLVSAADAGDAGARRCFGRGRPAGSPLRAGRDAAATELDRLKAELRTSGVHIRGWGGHGGLSLLPLRPATPRTGGHARRSGRFPRRGTEGDQGMVTWRETVESLPTVRTPSRVRMRPESWSPTSMV